MSRQRQLSNGGSCDSSLNAPLVDQRPDRHARPDLLDPSGETVALLDRGVAPRGEVGSLCRPFEQTCRSST